MKINESNDYSVNQIKLSEVVNTLRNSKKLILFITLIITSLSALYSFQKTQFYESEALIEIGSNIDNKLFEKQNLLIQEMKIQFIHKNNEILKDGNLNFKSLENRLLLMTYKSNLRENHDEILNELLTFIENRHSNLLTKLREVTKNEIIYDITRLDNEIEFLNEKNRVRSEIEINDTINAIADLKNEIKFLNEKNRAKSEIEINETIIAIADLKNEIKFLNEKYRVKSEIEKVKIDSLLPELESKILSLRLIIKDDLQNLALLEENPVYFIQRASESPTLNQVIYSYQDKLIDYENQKTNLLKKRDSMVGSLTVDSDLKLYESLTKVLSDKNNLEFALENLKNDNLNSGEAFNLLQDKKDLEFALKNLKNDKLKSVKVFNLLQNKKDLEYELEVLDNRESTLTRLVGKITTTEIGIKALLFIFYGFIFGLITSILIVFIKDDFMVKS